MDVRELELSADRQFLNQELEIIVAGQRNDAALGISRPDAQCRRQRPAKRTGLTGIDPAARLVNVEELAARDLRQADNADIAGVLAERLVHLLIDALRLDRNIVEVGAAVHGPFPHLALASPG